MAHLLVAYFFEPLANEENTLAYMLNFFGSRFRSTCVAAGLMLAAVCAAGVNSAAGQAAPGAGAAPAEARTMPTLFLAGDSTMAGGGGATRGWGNALAPFFDGSRIKVENHAIAGRSSRGYMDDARGWGTIQPKLQKGDFVFIQFGHNDDEGSALNVLRFRFTLSGVGDEAAEFEVPASTQAQGNPNAVPGTKITVHTFGYYIKKMATDAQAAGATPIIVSSIPRNAWSNGIIIRGEERHGPWAKEVAEALKVPFVDLNETVAKVYDPLGRRR